jgi:molecular chaperone DnaK (HSP70)
MQIGIDIGTHHAYAAYLNTAGVPQLVKHAHGVTALPAYVRQTMHTLLVGEAAAESLVGNSETTLVGCTRLMGRASQLPQQLLSRLPYTIREVGGEAICDLLYAEVHASAAFGQIARTLADAAERQTEQRVESVILTVPAGAEDRFRVQARAALEAQGLRVRRLVSQPSAAILGRTTHSCGNLAIVSCSGGLAEVSIATCEPLAAANSASTQDIPAIRIRATAADALLGGDDLAWTIAERLNAYFVASTGCNVFAADQSRSAALGLRRVAEELLQTLCTSELAPIVIDHGGGFGRDLSAVIMRHELINWLQPYFSHMRSLCRRVLKAARIRPGDISEVILIGDWIHIPGLEQILPTVFECQPEALHTQQAATLAVSGAARMAAMATPTIWDVTPYPLGINCYYGETELFSPIISANTPIPTANAQTAGAFTQSYTTRFANQTSVTLDVLQYRGLLSANPHTAERVPPEACEKLGSWQFNGLYPKPGHSADFTVTFSVDQDGILHLTARETATGHTLNGTVQRGVG